VAQQEGHSLGDSAPPEAITTDPVAGAMVKAFVDKWGELQDRRNLVLQETVHFGKKIATYQKSLSEMPDKTSVEAQKFKLIIHMMQVERGKACEKALATRVLVPVTNQNPKPLRRLLSAAEEEEAHKYLSSAKKSCETLLGNMPAKPVFTLPASTYAAYASASAAAKNVKKNKDAEAAKTAAEAAESAKALQKSYASAAAEQQKTADHEKNEEAKALQKATAYASSAAEVAA